MEPANDQTFNNLTPVTSTKANRAGAYRAEQQIRKGYSDKSGSFTAPSEAAKDAYEKSSPGMLATWYLGRVATYAGDPAELMSYPISSDFNTVSRQALVETRALATNHGDIEIAQIADHLLQVMDGNTIPVYSGMAGLSMKVDTSKGSVSYVTAADNPPHEPYGAVEYADPGFQADKKKRYPIDTPEHIRAAWSYINQGKNADAYSSEQVAHIKAKIVSAWKAKIDPKGPPSA